MKKSVFLMFFLLFSGCQQSFSPQYLIDKPRVIAIVADSPELKAGEETEVQVYFALKEKIKSFVWRLCVLALPASTGYECADPKLEFEIGENTEKVLVKIPEFVKEMIDEFKKGVDESKDFEFLIKLSFTSEEEQEFLNIKRLKIDGDGRININPVLDRLTIDGKSFVNGDEISVKKGKKYEFIPVLKKGSVQSFDNIRFAFFTTIGSFDYSMTTYDYPENYFTVEEKDLDENKVSNHKLWIVAYDLLGGESVLSFNLKIE